MEALGRHLLVEFYGCDGEGLKDTEMIRALMIKAAEASKVTVVSECFHTFSPYGVSGVLVIEESHLTVHTWPESGYAAVDLFTCGPADPWEGFKVLQKGLKATHHSVTELRRGFVEKKAELREVPLNGAGDGNEKHLPVALHAPPLRWHP